MAERVRHNGGPGSSADKLLRL
ncbi:protein of unknown function [Candidatus Filomicrobium marinum]|uniref:Uncharacterized protein n=1 Tax=Candidatus Filomicrobium marinum TaxID=1608628 RepID=A0A0D6JK56_9HYPH|nr:protein of unknown function [Candidatus Filomicrobium marinum]CPR22067.1 protein of unknown function [Candidatus Filomicrobium marinum]